MTMMANVVVSELAPLSVSADVVVRTFQLHLNNVTIELCSLGATITKILLPNYKHPDRQRDDVVLSYASPKTQFDDRNSVYFGAIVGRVANRIKNGSFQLYQTEVMSDSDEPRMKLETYQLETNNGPNHLHGGFDGFGTRNWDSAIINDSQGQVQFTLTSHDEDQGYPAGIEVTATYSLKQSNDSQEGVKLHLSMSAKLLPGETKATPISLAQHSYFNLASHSSRERILNHVLTMPNCRSFTPVDGTSIPTREVRTVADSSMDFTTGQIMSDALVRNGEENGLDPMVARDNIQVLNKQSINNSPIYGFDHNYAIHQEHTNEEAGLFLAAILEHHPSGRSLRVRTTAPGVQLYTANYLDGMNPSISKDECSYDRWQGVCLETQTYPDCIILENEHDNSSGFEAGKCFVLRPGGDDYSHDVVFEFASISSS
ncbi:hypothetical protein ACHAWO_005190 [Cyclotella atomus]|uniref:Aldose 1-epimerase n=1 Tax=Cyclotella atomus TaxID=382360 RepID=A0ABD3PG20_9STRA